MKNPNPINLMTTKEVQDLGWAAEARDRDGHLISTVGFLDDVPINENLKSLGEFIAECEAEGHVVQVFSERLVASLT